MTEPQTVKFLLVDDLPENLTALEALLRRDGLELDQARSGPEALELLLRHDYALALLDVQMPDMDGFELAELMRGTERTRQVPIIFITAAATDERRRFRGYAAGAIDYIHKPIDPQMLRNKTEVFYQLAAQRLELARRHEELQDTAGQLAAALGRLQAHGDNSPLAAIEFAPDLSVRSWSKGAERIFGWQEAEVIGRPVGQLRLAPDEDRQAFADALRTMTPGAGSRTVHVCRNSRADGSIIECEWYNSALFDASGALVSINAQALDVTERKRAEETQRLLIGELNHRVKNTLATVQAIATQTLRHSESPSAFAGAFSGRIQALARAHSILSNATWRGAMLTELIQDQLRLGALDEAKLTVAGPDVRLPPQLALHLALILHELVTNANKYGSLSLPAGKIAVSWTIADEQLRFSWVESGGRATKAPSRRGFGATLIEQSAKAEGGEAHVFYRADGIAWDIVLALPDDAVSRTFEWRGQAESGAAQNAPPPRRGQALAGRRLLVVEDEPLVALELVTILADAGAEVTGPAGSVEQALEMISSGAFDGALLDANLHGKSVDAVAAALTRARVPFAFVSGYGPESLPPAFAGATHLLKPFTDAQVLDAASKLVGPAGDVVSLRK